MRGVDSQTGKALSGIEHLRQSVRDILTTPIGSRVMRREYGSQLFRMIDAPLNRSTVMDIYAATAEALARWEPRIKVTAIQVAMPSPGRLEISLEGYNVEAGGIIALQGITIQ